MSAPSDGVRARCRPGDGHYDMGLLTIIPKSTSPGLQIRTVTNNATGWRAKTAMVDIEQTLQQDEAIMFGGMTLGRLIGQPALFHNVCVRGLMWTDTSPHAALTRCHERAPTTRGP